MFHRLAREIAVQAALNVGAWVLGVHPVQAFGFSFVITAFYCTAFYCCACTYVLIAGVIPEFKRKLCTH